MDGEIDPFRLVGVDGEIDSFGLVGLNTPLPSFQKKMVLQLL